MDLLVSSLVGGLIGLILGIVFEDILKRLKDRFIHLIRRSFRRPVNIPVPFHFSFGQINTAEVIVDGDGQSVYTPLTIHCYYDPTPIVLPQELEEIRNRIAEQEAVKKKSGEPYMWNTKSYALKRFTRGRTDDEENLEINLWFGPTDYFTYRATNVGLDSEYVLALDRSRPVSLREKYFPDVVWSSPSLQPVPFFGSGFGMNCCLISGENKMILVKRSDEVATGKGLYSIAINETLQRPVDRSNHDDAPDPYRAIIRGAAEELGLELPNTAITFFTFNVTTTPSTWGIHGMARTKDNAQEIIDSRGRIAKDRWESKEIIPIDFEVKAVLEFVKIHTPWAPNGLACIYYTLVHEFGKRPVDEAIRKYMH